MDKQYLKPTTKIEPLIWNWYAWPYLIPPHTAACNVVERHLKIMESYVANPKIHADAVKNPKMLGGPFIDLDGLRTDEISKLIVKTKSDCVEYITLNETLKTLDRLLQVEAIGDSLETIYQKIPQPLKGLIELVYDLNNRPSMRLIEPLFYKTYYTDIHQTLALSTIFEDERKFLLSTPRLDQKDEIYINTGFSSPDAANLLRMREKPYDLNLLKEIFKIPENKQKLFNSLFTPEIPIKLEDRNYNGNGVRLRYFGHACLLVETDSVSILFDPVVSYPIPNNEVPRYTFADLPDHIDYVIITHNHQDHLMFETLLQLRHKVGQLIFPSNQLGALQDPSIKLIMQHVGFSSCIEMKEMESIPIKDGEIIALPFLGEHADLNIQSKLSFYIQIKKKKFLFAADSNNIEPTLYDRIFKWIGGIDFLFLGMECEGAPLTWLYGPLLSQPIKRSFDRNRTLSGSNFDKAYSIAQKSQCKEAYIYAMGQEPWLGYIMSLKYESNSIQMTESDKFVQNCRENGVTSERLFGKKEWVLK